MWLTWYNHRENSYQHGFAALDWWAMDSEVQSKVSEGHEFSGPVHGQTFPVSEEKMAGSLSSVVHNPWISWLGHEFSGPVYDPDLSCLRRK